MNARLDLPIRSNCYGCTERHLNCHDECKIYKEYKENLARLRKIEKARKGTI